MVIGKRCFGGRVSLPMMSPCIELLASSFVASMAAATAAEVLLHLALGKLGAAAATAVETLGVLFFLGAMLVLWGCAL